MVLYSPIRVHTGCVFGLPSWMYIDCSRRAPQIGILFVFLRSRSNNSSISRRGISFVFLPSLSSNSSMIGYGGNGGRNQIDDDSDYLPLA